MNVVLLIAENTNNRKGKLHEKLCGSTIASLLLLACSAQSAVTISTQKGDKWTKRPHALGNGIDPFDRQFEFFWSPV